MKRITIIVIAFCCALLLSTHTSYAQLGHIVMGKVLNPDASEPGEADIEIRAYLTKDISDTCDKKYCGPTGGWAIDTIFDGKQGIHCMSFSRMSVVMSLTVPHIG